MTSIKQPNWDKRKGSLVIMANPDGPNKRAARGAPQTWAASNGDCWWS
jgi:hypothetical protein